MIVAKNFFSNKLKMTVILPIILLLLVSSTVSGCTGSVNNAAGNTSASNTTTAKDTLVIGEPWSVSSLDPGTSSNTLWNYRIAESLVEIDLDGSLKPGLASSWENNGTSWIFHLRQDVKFHDGKPMTAYDVKYSIDRTLNLSKTNMITLGIIKCNVLDTYTVEMVTETPDASIPGRMSGQRAIIYSNTSTMDAKGVITLPIATGPFKVASLDSATDKLTLDRFDQYYNGTARLAHVIIIFNMANANSREMAIENGDVDMTVEPTVASTSRLKSNPDLNVDVYTWHGQYMLKFGNLTTAPYNDVRVRKAIAYALDRENLVNNLLLDRGIVNDGNGVPTVAKWYNGDITGYSYNVSMAKALLAEAGWIDTNGDGIVEKDGKAFKISLYYDPDDNPAHAVQGPAIQAELLAIGIDCEIKTLTYSSISPHQQDWGFLWLTYTVPLMVNDPSYFADNTFKSTGSSNTYKYSNSSVDNLLVQARSEMDQTKRYQLYGEVQKIVTDYDCVNVYFSQSRYCVITRSNLKGYAPYAVCHNWRLNKDMYFV